MSSFVQLSYEGFETNPVPEGDPMTNVLDRLIQSNPLLAHGVRTHSTGVALPAQTAAPKRRARWDVDAPKVHLGHAGR